MNKAQATKIHRRLLSVNKALTKVDEAISELNKEDRAVFSEPMAELWGLLHGKALRSFMRDIQSCGQPLMTSTR